MASSRVSMGIVDEEEAAVAAGVAEMNKIASADPIGAPVAPTDGPAMACAAAAVDTVESAKETRNKKSDARVNPPESVPYFSLYKYADRLDYFYMLVGTFGGICDGLLMPISVVIVIQLVNAFVGYSTDPEQERRTARKVLD